MSPLKQASASIPDAFLCPITSDIMIAPMMTRSGLCFDRTAILEWLVHHGNTCPLTRAPLNASNLVPNHALQFRIEMWCEEHNVEWNGSSHQVEDGDSVIVTCLTSTVEERRKMKQRKQQKTSSVVPVQSRISRHRSLLCKVLSRVR
ncbi:hypothetical protein MPSEU_000597100 [Mayamaea pseudoterrestris]|nr:hypothetical protein MPSEU_000597100 [Mayamaea pseudoterrestris]